MEQETWVELGGNAAGYRASSLGRISNKKGLVLRPNPTWDGYIQVMTNRHTRRIHRLVCEAFHGPCPDGFVCNHKDGVKTNNRPDNLEWVTISQNTLHSFRTGLQIPARGEGKAQSKLTEEAVREALKPDLKRGELAAIARRYGVYASALSSARAGKSWRYLTAA